MHRAVARAAAVVAPPVVEDDADLVRRYLEDAAHFPGGHARGMVRPATADEVAAVLQVAPRVLVIGAQSSLTGGATPAGDLLLSTERLQHIERRESTVTAGAGVTLQVLQQTLAAHGRWLPPVPTFLGATVGGAVSTNAAGAATFKYGTMRNWIEGLTVVLADGAVLDLCRGEVTSSDSGRFDIATGRRSVVLDVPALAMPRVPKCSAGYFAAPGMDLVDLFVGSEGTLGVIVSVTFRTAPLPDATCLALVALADERRAIALVEALRTAAQATWHLRDPHGIDVAAIEHIDRRALAILREDGIDRRLQVRVPPETDVVLLVQLEVAAAEAAGDLWSRIADALSADAPDASLVRFCRLLNWYEALENTEMALSENAARRQALLDFREAAPVSVNRRVALAKRQVDPRIHKTAGDSVVPFARFGEMMHTCRRLFAERSLDLAVWGHISDGNVHPNVVPRSYADVSTGREVLLALGREVIAMDGSPLAEHGVGRSALKQELLRMLYGESGIASMQRVKHALDPDWKLARGVLFAPPAPRFT